MIQDFRLFVASPGDVLAERKVLEDVVKEINDVHGPPLGYRLELVQWQTHTAPGARPPQEEINDQIGKYDIFVGIMWRRFGTPTLTAGSGTEEEYRKARTLFEKNSELIIMFYFCQKPTSDETIDEIEQKKKVLLFRKELEGQSLTWTYKNKNEFKDLIRKHLCLRLSKIMNESGTKGNFRAKPDDNTINVLRGLWDRMEPDLQKAFSIAYNENRQVGDPGIQTRDLFAALMRVGTPQVSQIIKEIPKAALPKATRGIVVEEPYIIQERPWLSGCVSSSICRLSEILPPDRKLSSADIFADIAKNGTGTSVKLLRQHNIKPEDIDRILQEKNIQVVKT